MAQRLPDFSTIAAAVRQSTSHLPNIDMPQPDLACASPRVAHGWEYSSIPFPET
ncbi:MAG: hypothetical protein QNJ97_08135 [Myxococcota bacterium]|nr:hypothetical protein [Myxococcota bacterium]